MIIKFKDEIMPVPPVPPEPQKYFVETPIDFSQDNSGVLLVSVENDEHFTIHVTRYSEDHSSADIELLPIAESTIHDDRIDYSEALESCLLDLRGDDSWQSWIRESMPEYADTEVTTIYPLDLPDGAFFNFFGHPVTTYMLHEEVLSRNFNAESSQDFFNSVLRARYADVYYLPYLGKYFALAYSTEPQNIENNIDVDIFMLPGHDAAVDKEEYERYIREMYPEAYFITPTVWEYFQQYIDWPESRRITRYIWMLLAARNEQANTSELTIDQLKNFRTWLAKQLYDDYGEEHETDEGNPAPVLGATLNTTETDMMLKYYKNNLYDDVIAGLTKLGDASASMSDFLKMYGIYYPKTTIKGATVIPGTASKCNCGGSLNVYDMGITACDCVSIYRKNVYAQMVKDFSNIQFWIDRHEILPLFYKYIEGIIKNNFPLGVSEHSTIYCDCTCNSANDQQEANMNILRNLLKAIGYMIDETDADEKTTGISGHKNFIGESLNKWAVILYEKMQWV